MLELGHKAMSGYKFQLSKCIQTVSLARYPSHPVTVISLLLMNRRTRFPGCGGFQHCGTHRRGDIKGGQRANVELNASAPPDFHWV